jgi:hypothetical protein
MKNLLYTIIFLLAFTLIPNSSVAQGSYLSAGYRIAFPMSSFKDYIKTTSFRGVQFDYKYFFNENIALGFQYNWNAFYEDKERQTYQNELGAITAEQFNFSYSNNLLVGLDYYVPTDVIVKPFIGAKLGSGYIEVDRFAGALQIEESLWGFSYSATLGALFQIPNTSLAFTLEGSWNQVISDNIHFKNFSNIGLFLGFCYSAQYRDI